MAVVRTTVATAGRELTIDSFYLRRTEGGGWRMARIGVGYLGASGRQSAVSVADSKLAVI